MVKRFIYLLMFFMTLPALSNAKPIRVGIVNHVPFAVVENNKPQGLAVDIWESVAKSLDWQYTFTPVRQNLHQGFEDLRTGKIDVLIGAIPVDERGLSFAEFSRPYFINKIGFIVKDTNQTFLDYMKTIFGFVSFKAILIVAMIFIIFSHLIWFFERGDTVPGSYCKGLLASFWFALTSFLIKEKKPEPFSRDKRPEVPIHYGTRIIIFFWFLASTTVLATLIASITSSLTMSLTDTSKKYTLSDFRNKKVAMVEDTDFIVKMAFSMNPVIVPTFEDAMNLLKEGKVMAVIEDTPTARYQLQKAEYQGYRISNVTLGYNEQAFAFPKHSKLRHQFDVAYDKLKSKGQIDEFCSRYLYMEGAMFCDL